MKANASRYHGKARAEIDWTEKQRQKRAVAEYLAVLEAETVAEGDAQNDNESGGPEGKRQRRYERQPPKVISLSDPQSAWTAKANKRVQFGYGLNYLIDIENAVIVDVEATPARTYDEVAATQTMLDRAEERFDLKPRRLAADTAYGTGKFLGWLVKEKKIIPHIPVWEMSDRQDGILSRSDFHWDRKRGAYSHHRRKTSSRSRVDHRWAHCPRGRSAGQGRQDRPLRGAKDRSKGHRTCFSISCSRIVHASRTICALSCLHP